MTKVHEDLEGETKLQRSRSNILGRLVRAPFLPFVYNKSFRQKRKGETANHHDHHACMEVPRRPVTPPLPPSHRGIGKIRKKQRSFAQEQSPLFRLPPEIRGLIYKELVGDEHGACHVYCAKPGWSYAYCKVPKDQVDHSECWSSIEPLFWMPASSKDQNFHWKDVHLSLLLTCRRIYSEAIDVLYQENMFSLNVKFFSDRFLNDLLPQRLDTIRSLSLEWRFQEMQLDPIPELKVEGLELGCWRGCCRTLAGMTGLKTLRWSLSLQSPSGRKECIFDADDERIALEPLAQIRSPRIYTVHVDWKGRLDTSRAEEDLPYKLIRADTESENWTKADMLDA